MSTYLTGGNIVGAYTISGVSLAGVQDHIMGFSAERDNAVV